jgi:hypothetical protein
MMSGLDRYLKFVAASGYAIEADPMPPAAFAQEPD